MAKRLRCALLGLGGEGKALLDAVLSNRALKLIALGDPEHPALQETAEAAGAQAFADCRLLVVETLPDAVFVALPAYQASDYVRASAERGIAVFQLAPWAIDFEVAATLVRLFGRHKGMHVVARPWQMEPAYERLGDVGELLGRVHTVNVEVMCARCRCEGWLADAHSAGGGALFNDAYEQVDMVVTLCGLPEQVYAVAGWVPGPGEARPYDTEDAMSVVCKYSQDRLATITSCRAADKADWTVTLRGSRASARITPQRLRITAPSGGKIVDRRVRNRNRYSAVVTTFATALREIPVATVSSSRDHLPTMAVMQAAYLSTKTGDPESPTKFLDMAVRT